MTGREIRLRELSNGELRRLVLEMKVLNVDLWKALNTLAQTSPYTQRHVEKLKEAHRGRLDFLEKHLTTIEDDQKAAKKAARVDRVIWKQFEVKGR
jgi:hypothetical protein